MYADDFEIGVCVQPCKFYAMNVFFFLNGGMFTSSKMLDIMRVVLVGLVGIMIMIIMIIPLCTLIVSLWMYVICLNTIH